MSEKAGLISKNGGHATGYKKKRALNLAIYLGLTQGGPPVSKGGLVAKNAVVTDSGSNVYERLHLEDELT